MASGRFSSTETVGPVPLDVPVETVGELTREYRHHPFVPLDSRRLVQERPCADTKLALATAGEGRGGCWTRRGDCGAAAPTEAQAPRLPPRPRPPPPAAPA